MCEAGERVTGEPPSRTEIVDRSAGDDRAQRRRGKPTTPVDETHDEVGADDEHRLLSAAHRQRNETVKTPSLIADIYTPIHTDIHTVIHTHTCTDIQTFTHTDTQTYPPTPTHIHTRNRVSSCTLLADTDDGVSIVTSLLAFPRSVVAPPLISNTPRPSRWCHCAIS
ncbi:unnamed protein product [Angiostrongylus costaricensis]|uniref:Uncharacterized protein n=1 Tax=Angiostrongylus costaricensis TaxID=334426 RepID=A0A0R3PWL0_ANGCS|nr:unnamed protein product [Angiostrongylus costaricensis]